MPEYVCDGLLCAELSAAMAGWLYALGCSMPRGPELAMCWVRGHVQSSSLVERNVVESPWNTYSTDSLCVISSQPTTVVERLQVACPVLT